MTKWLLLSIGGIVGTIARYEVATWIPGIAGTNFPYGTLVINLSACLLIGLFSSLSDIREVLSPEARLFLMTGFCGAYSTFSTWILETSNLFKDGEIWRALINVTASTVLGFMLFRLGVFLGTIL